MYIFGGNPSSNLSSNVIYSQNSGSLSCFPFSNSILILLTCASSSFPTHVLTVMIYSTQTSCAGMSSPAVLGTMDPPLDITHLLSYSYLPHRCPGHTLHLRSPPQPEGVAKPRGRSPPRRAEELGEQLLKTSTSYCSHLWAYCPLMGCN